MRRNASIALVLAVATLANAASANELNPYWPAAVRALQDQQRSPDESPATAVLKEYHNAALKEFRVAYGNWLQFREGFEPVRSNIDRIFDARADLTSSDQTTIKLLQEKREIAKTLEAQAAELAKHPPSTREIPAVYFQYYSGVQIEATGEYRAEIEIELQRVQGKKEAKADLTLAPLFLQVNSTATR